jgi:hypothetical protein
LTWIVHILPFTSQLLISYSCSISEPEPVKQNEVPQEEKKDDAPKPAEGDAMKTADVEEEKKATVVNGTEAAVDGEKKEGEVPTEKEGRINFLSKICQIFCHRTEQKTWFQSRILKTEVILRRFQKVM